jgi:hypothetical protein
MSLANSLTAMCIQIFGRLVRVGKSVLALRFAPAAVTELFAVLNGIFFASIIPVILWGLRRAAVRHPTRTRVTEDVTE